MYIQQEKYNITLVLFIMKKENCSFFPTIGKYRIFTFKFFTIDFILYKQVTA